MIDLIVAFGLFIIMSVGVLWQYNNEKKDWNKGICSKSGLPWTHFDTDSSGARMYKDGLGNYCTISWDIDNK